jgi:hypothetical protein
MEIPNLIFINGAYSVRSPRRCPQAVARDVREVMRALEDGRK